MIIQVAASTYRLKRYRCRTLYMRERTDAGAKGQLFINTSLSQAFATTAMRGMPAPAGIAAGGSTVRTFAGAPELRRSLYPWGTLQEGGAE